MTPHFSPSLVSLLAEKSLEKACHYYICLIFFFLLGMFATLLWVFACTLFVCGGAWNNQSKLLRVGTAVTPQMGFFLSGKGRLRFHWVHKLTLLTCTFSVRSGIKTQKKKENGKDILIKIKTNAMKLKIFYFFL